MLKLRLGNIPLRIHPSFLLTTVILQANMLSAPGGMSLLLVWFAVVLVSIVFHELGHALMGKAFGLTPEMDLHGMGGAAAWAAGRKLKRYQSVLVSLAGPVAGLLLGGAVLLVQSRMPEPDEPLARAAFQFSKFVNIYWSIFNLLPILPLDGGNVFRDILQAATKGRGELAARAISILVAIGVGLAMFLETGDWWVPLLCALFAVSNFRALREITLAKRDEALNEPLKTAVEALERSDGARVVALARPIVERAASARMRAEAIHVLAFGLLLERRVEEADAVMRTLPAGFSASPSYVEVRGQVASGSH